MRLECSLKRQPTAISRGKDIVLVDCKRFRALVPQACIEANPLVSMLIERKTLPLTHLGRCAQAAKDDYTHGLDAPVSATLALVTIC